jgi:excisionase family DNA binding protein
MSLKRNNQTFYTTAEACRLAGTNRETFLRWVRQGNFTDVEYRDGNGWRLFTKEDVLRLKAKVNYIEKISPIKDQHSSFRKPK